MTDELQSIPYFLFDWAKVPGKDNNRLLNHIERCFRLPWVKEATISKSSDNQTIVIVPKGSSFITRKEVDSTTIITNVGDWISLKKMDEKCSVILEINGKIACEYRIQRQNEEIHIGISDIRCILRMVDEKDEETFKRLTKALRAQSWKNIQDLIDLSHSDDSIDSHKAVSLLLSLGDIAILPLLHSIRLTKPEEALWEFETIIDTAIETRLRIAQILESMLGDTRVFIEAEENREFPLESVPHQRICDGAYLLLRRLLAFDESKDENLVNEFQYLKLSDPERDTEISRMKTSKRWVSMTETL